MLCVIVRCEIELVYNFLRVLKRLREVLAFEALEVEAHHGETVAEVQGS